MAMTEIQGLTGTAFIVAECRAHENAEANPLYVDRIVPLFLDEGQGRPRTVFRQIFRQSKRWSG
jgi:hypothetical protein